MLQAIEALTANERVAAVRGYHYFGLAAAADILEDIAQRWDDGRLDLDDVERLEIEADERYTTVVADDDVLLAAFEARYETEPSAFDALD